MAIKIFLKAIRVAIVLFMSIVLWSSPSYALLYSKTGVPLSETDFVDLDKEFIKQTDPLFLKAGSTSKDDFSKKWRRSLLGEPVEFFRSYPPAYHHDLAQIPTDKIPGEEGLCFGDAHPENFGFLSLTHGTLFGYNDLDDPGYCPVAYDALRFFTALRLWFDDDLTKDVLEKYGDVVKDPTRISTILYPDWEQEANDVWHKKTDENDGKKHFKNIQDENDSLHPIATSDSRYTSILSMASKDTHFANYTIVDIASREKWDGGSAGLTRYWLLVEDKSGNPFIVELKEAVKPGVEYGRTLQRLSMNERLPVLKKTFWKEESDNNNFYVTVNTNPFLVRNRLTMKGIKIKDYKDSERKDLLEAEASIMATFHSEHWNSVKKDDLRNWLWKRSEVLAKRWQAVYDKYHSKRA